MSESVNEHIHGKKRRIIRRSSGPNPGWEEREKKRQEREEKIEKILEVANSYLSQLSPPSSSYTSIPLPEFNEEYYKKQAEIQRNYEMRNFLKQFVVIQSAVSSKSIWQAHADYFKEQFEEIEKAYPVS